MDPKSRKCIFLGYADGVKGYLLWDPTSRKVIVNRDVIFAENELQREQENDSTSKDITTFHIDGKSVEDDSFEAEPEDERVIINRRAKAWLDAANDFLLDAEDVLDEINIQILQCEFEVESQIRVTRPSKLWTLFNASTSSIDEKIESRMQEFADNLECLGNKKDTLLELQHKSCLQHVCLLNHLYMVEIVAKILSLIG
ncbi:hypothetical protein KIW84_013908 [Lathyrus oleraceus]|uniref:Retroviral polymerase SH3-like domain-containing protein n=1 Tax=Pisum sativum TaxID=3888 RepID=A0A9D5GYE5_PEA|nr:hypothetical protein KIW84_013908 [Pisum sativum]